MQTFSINPYVVLAIAGAESNQQSPNLPCAISFKLAAPFAKKKCGFSNIWVTRRASACEPSLSLVAGEEMPYTGGCRFRGRIRCL